MQSIPQLIAAELTANPQQINAAIELLDEGATVPFIARYRKEKTGGLTDIQLRQLEQRLDYLRQLNDRRQVILQSIAEQEALSDSLRQQIEQATTKSVLEDLYLPFKAKRKTKGRIAIEAGLTPLLDEILQQPHADLQQLANAYLNSPAPFTDIDNILSGAKSIFIERIAENTQLLSQFRTHLQKNGVVYSKKITTKKTDHKINSLKYSDYFDYHEPLQKIASHRVLAILRGRHDGVLNVKVGLLNTDQQLDSDYFIQQIMQHYRIPSPSHPRDKWLHLGVKEAWQQKLSQYLETDLLANLREQAETQAITVFSNNLQDVLMAPPAGAKVTLGLDPGLKTGVKAAIVDLTGQLVRTFVIYPHAPQNHWDKSTKTLVNMIKEHRVTLVAIGNGTGSRETDKLIAAVLKTLDDPTIDKTIVSEAGASVYSASEAAIEEFPDLDVTYRGAVSIARRLQDPLAELVKIEPKSIGVGQYQHDVNQNALTKSLSAVVEDCVNKVGVDLNQASAALLTFVSGLTKSRAQKIIDYRNQFGQFSNRQQLKKIRSIGPKVFEQCAGFLRIYSGDEPLDCSGVHPESYPIVSNILDNAKTSIQDLFNNSALVSGINPENFITATVGLPTVKDILQELEKPGRDPRPAFKTVQFKLGVEHFVDLKVGMILEGVVSNVANFGAFIDIGVHQDGLVHISSMTDKFVSDPRSVVKAGDIVQVRVIDLDQQRKRIGLSMKLQEPSNKIDTNSPPTKHHQPRASSKKPTHKSTKQHASNQMMGNAFAEAFAKMKK